MTRGKMQPMDLFREHSDRVVIMGCSCVGKTTMAQQMTEHSYVCFDAIFPWHEIETLCLPMSKAMEHVRDSCDQIPKFVLDGWNLCDSSGIYFPKDITLYVLYANYSQVIDQYRVPVADFNEHMVMFEKWYGLPYEKFPDVRYFENCQGIFVERFSEDFNHFLSTKSMN